MTMAEIPDRVASPSDEQLKLAEELKVRALRLASIERALVTARRHHGHEMEEELQELLRHLVMEMECEPLLPVEKKLIGWSIGLGISLLGILFWVTNTFFPVGP
jgi:hypothetical protein